MKRFVEGVDREQSTLFPDRLEDWICDDNPVRVINVFVDQLDHSWALQIKLCHRKSPQPDRPQHPSPPKFLTYSKFS